MSLGSFDRASLLAIPLFFLIVACSDKENMEANQSLENTAYHIFEEGPPPALAWADAEKIYNKEALIPSQCYTLTDSVSNPCYTCHQTYPTKEQRPNRQSDGFFQGLYLFSSIGETNHWINLFKDREDYIASVSDTEIIDYVEEENFTDLIKWMKTEEWTGHVPEIQNLALGAEAFDELGLAKDGSRWVAFNYKPLPSTFWPTNGSTDDVMIRLPKKFSEIRGEFSRDLYFANLSLLEMAVTGMNQIETPSINEAAIDSDIDGDGVYSVRSSQMKRTDYYLGDAADELVADMLYPKGTAFLHTVRYVGVDSAGNIYNSPRMKEVRYMVKENFLSDGGKGSYYLEAKEKYNEKLPKVSDYGDRGMSNKFGWMVWGFIEDEKGDLRKQTQEEQMFCMGCHKSIGTTIDHTFAFPRKPAGAEGWGYIDLRKIADAPNIGETEGEFLTYLKRVGGGDEFRANQEMLDRWFLPDGSVDELAVSSANSIYELITPSRERALELNKAYKAIVEEQSYIYGRDTVIGAIENVAREVNIEIPPLDSEHRYDWDIRLDWNQDSGVQQPGNEYKSQYDNDFYSGYLR